MRFIKRPLCLVRVRDLPEGIGAYEYGPVVTMAEKYQDDRGFLEHELQHVRQFWAWFVAGALLTIMLCVALFILAPWWTVGIGAALGACVAFGHFFLYRFSRAYRFSAEARAYIVQMQYPDRKGGQLSMQKAAELLAGPIYKLGITVEDAYARLLRVQADDDSKFFDKLL